MQLGIVAGINKDGGWSFETIFLLWAKVLHNSRVQILS
jgi:hypothetical protein